MKFLPVLFSLILLNTLLASAQLQVITHDDFETVIPYLQREDFKGAFEKTRELITTTRDDSSDVRGIVIYMNIFSAAGMVTQDLMTHDDFLTNAYTHIGQRIVMPAHPCVDSSSLVYNTLKFITYEGKTQGLTVTANKARTNILLYEYFDYSRAINQDVYIGKNVRSGGRLRSIEVNPNKSKVWIARLHITNAWVRLPTARN
ncbi:MAG TPA: hypothetical protein VIN08_12740 [Ohtaekwangia sp.]|uniref:hypothetical protein n=1 Tax=Ohtaekwangia sp. TaxID=2066019 RepID=UPI002F91CC5C